MLVCLVVRIFFLILFIGSILLCNVIFLVIVRLVFILCCVKVEVNEVVIVIFVDGLFFGIVFLGIWIWMFQLLKIFLFRFKSEVCVLIYLSVSIVDFFIILFKFLVNVRCLFLLWFRLVLINKILFLMVVYVNFVIILV